MKYIDFTGKGAFDTGTNPPTTRLTGSSITTGVRFLT